MPTSLPDGILFSAPAIRTAAAAIKPLSDDDSIQYILADIPFFAVGLLAFGIFTFFLVMRRVNRMVLILHASAFLAFIAAIFDLSQNLVRGRGATDSGQNIGSVMGLIIVREIGLSLSVGLRFLFFWFFVAQPPAGEQNVPGEMHSGSWGRWGVLGMILRWTLLAICLVIPILQVIHRTVSSLHKLGGVYEVEGTLEVIASAVFILKLGLNTFLAVLSTPRGEPRWRSLQSYVAMILALVLSTGVGIGNVAQFQFSETVLGRFIQGVMTYILLVYILIYIFFDLRQDTTPSITYSSRSGNTSSSFQGLPPVNQTDSFFHITPPMASVESVGPNSRRPSNFSRNSSSHKSQKEKPRKASPTTRRSNPSRLSALFVPRRFSGRAAVAPDDDADRLWNQDDAEKGLSPHVTFQSQEVDLPPPRSSEEHSPPGPKESAKWQDPMFTTVLKESAGDVPRSVSPRSPIPLPTLAIPPRALSRSSTPMPMGYNDSPVFGLNGIIRGQPAQAASASPPREMNVVAGSSPSATRVSSISYLLREQAELDQSIASLKLLTRAENLVEVRCGSETSSEGKLPSAAQSEFSLSNFPEPPWGSSSLEAEITKRTGAPPTVAALRQAATLRNSTSEPPKSVPLESPPSRGADLNRSLSVPFSDNGESSITGRNRSRIDSHGTQYEITSFIGDLSHPGHKQAPSSVSQGSTSNTSINEGPGDVKVANRLASKPASLVPSRSIKRLPETPRLGPGAGRGAFVGTGVPPMQRRSVIGLPPRPRLAPSGFLSPLVERSPGGEYERPRPAPFPSSRGQNT